MSTVQPKLSFSKALQLEHELRRCRCDPSKTLLDDLDASEAVAAACTDEHGITDWDMLNRVEAAAAKQARGR